MGVSTLQVAQILSLLHSQSFCLCSHSQYLFISLPPHPSPLPPSFPPFLPPSLPPSVSLSHTHSRYIQLQTGKQTGKDFTKRSCTHASFLSLTHTLARRLQQIYAELILFLLVCERYFETQSVTWCSRPSGERETEREGVSERVEERERACA